MGYSERQIRELSETIAATPAELILVGTPIDLSRLIQDSRPMIRIRYDLKPVRGPNLVDIVSNLSK
jgi:predicted GTPase